MEKIVSLIMLYSSIYNVDPKLAVSIAHVESSFNQTAIGTSGEIGIFQLHPRYFSYQDSLTIEENIKNGIKHLSFSKKYCRHKYGIEWVICYNRGVAKGSMAKMPSKDEYVNKVKTFYYSNATNLLNQYGRRNTNSSSVARYWH